MPSGIEELLAVMERLRSECEWTGRQSPASLAQYAIEEAHELVDAIEAGDTAEWREELGDLLFQVVFHAEIARREGEFDFDEIARAQAEKMIARHPHVFGDEPNELDSIARNWEARKRLEKPERTRLDDGVPRELPALQRAAKVLGRAERAGQALPEAASVPETEEALGEDLLALVTGARAQGLDAERALRQAVRRFADPA